METYYKRLKNHNSLFHETKRFSQKDYFNEDLTLKFVFSGSQSYQVNKKEFIVHPDCFLTINKGTNYESNIQSLNYVQSMSISFDSGFIHDMHRSYFNTTSYLLDNLSDNRVKEYTFPETILPLKSNLAFNLQHLNRYIKNKGSDDHLLEEYLHHSYINYLEIFNLDILQAQERLNCLKQHTKTEIIKRLNLAKDYIYCNYNQAIELKTIAEHSCLSVNHLLRTFKQAFGESPHQFLTKIRLKRANHLIKNSSYGINEIVTNVGFECSSSFIRLYKQHFQTTPARQRKCLNLV